MKQAKIFSITAIFILAVFGGVTASNIQLNPNSIVYAAPAQSQANVGLYESVFPVKTKYQVGDVLTFTIKATNYGPDKATMVNITDALTNDLGEGKGIEFVSASDSGSYNPKTHMITWHLPNLKKGESKTVSFQAKILKSAAGTNMTNKAEVWVAEWPHHIDANIVEIDIAKASNSSDNNSSDNTIPLQKTGLPVVGLTLAVMAVLCGLAMPKRKN